MPDLTVADLMDRWHELRSPSWSPRAALVNRGLIDRRIIPTLGTVKLWWLTPVDLDRFFLHAALRQAKRWRYIADNPASDATPPSVPRQQSRAYDPTLLRALLADLEEHQPDVAAFVRLAAITGARRGEIAALQWTDIEDATLTIRRSLVDGPDGWVEKPTKTDRTRNVALDARTVDLLTRWKATAGERMRAYDLALHPTSWVFPAALDPDGPTTPDVWSRRWEKARARHGLDCVRLHDLRHGVPTLLLPAATTSTPSPAGSATPAPRPPSTSTVTPSQSPTRPSPTTSPRCLTGNPRVTRPRCP